MDWNDDILFNTLPTTNLGKPTSVVAGAIQEQLDVTKKAIEKVRKEMEDLDDLICNTASGLSIGPFQNNSELKDLIKNQNDLFDIKYVCVRTSKNEILFLFSVDSEVSSLISYFVTPFVSSAVCDSIRYTSQLLKLYYDDEGLGRRVNQVVLPGDLSPKSYIAVIFSLEEYLLKIVDPDPDFLFQFKIREVGRSERLNSIIVRSCNFNKNISLSIIREKVLEGRYSHLFIGNKHIDEDLICAVAFSPGNTVLQIDLNSDFLTHLCENLLFQNVQDGELYYHCGENAGGKYAVLNGMLIYKDFETQYRVHYISNEQYNLFSSLVVQKDKKDSVDAGQGNSSYNIRRECLLKEMGCISSFLFSTASLAIAPDKDRLNSEDDKAYFNRKRSEFASRFAHHNDDDKHVPYLLDDVTSVNAYVAFKKKLLALEACTDEAFIE